MKKLGRIIRRIVLWFLVLSISSVVIFRWLPIPVTPFILVQGVKQAVDAKREFRIKKDWVPLGNIAPSLQLAVVCAEDQNFLNHYGFDVDAIEKAIKHNEKNKRKRGASTISQQTAKNVFLWDGRNWIRKGLEVYFTFLIEAIWSKERIMEVYLNVIEFGDGIYGAEAAAQHYYKKPALKLTKQQSALLAAVLPAPRKYSAKTPSAYIKKRQAWILKQMQNQGKDFVFERIKED